jgi:hypothetical protein
MTLRTLLVAAILTALCVGTIVVMYFDSQSDASPSVAEAPPVVQVPPEPDKIEIEETVESMVEELPPPTEYAASELPIEEEIVMALASEPAPAPEPAAMPVSSESATSSLLGQVSQDEIAKAFDMLGQLLGLPEVSPEELKRKVEKVGILRFRQDVPVEFMSRDELSSYIQDLFDTEYTPETAEREERVLRALGFLNPGQDLRGIRARVLNENIAGFYDERPHVRRLFAISSSSGRKLNLMNQLILSHELRHAIQDQHLDLGRALGKMSDYDDRRLAALSLIEGDATLLMEKYMASGQQEGDTGLDGLLGGLGGEMMDGRSMAEMFAGPELRSAPPVVREQLIVPYLEGRRLAGEIFEKGGFRSLNERLQRLPRSMEQVLHPEKYLDRVDEPIDVSLVGMSAADVESEGRIGELFVRTLLESTLPEAEGIEAAAGWGGDRYALWADDEGHYHLIWRTVWDTDRDAGEFFDALVRFASIKFGQGPTPAAQSDSVDLKGGDGSSSQVTRNGREVVLQRNGFK